MTDKKLTDKEIIKALEGCVYDDYAKCENTTGLRNRRSVWNVATQGYAAAHFATFPEKLIEPCILAGCRPRGVVLDSFLGSGTTAVVAEKNGRDFIGIDINPEYTEMSRKRIAVVTGGTDIA